MWRRQIKVQIERIREQKKKEAKNAAREATKRQLDRESSIFVALFNNKVSKITIQSFSVNSAK